MWTLLSLPVDLFLYFLTPCNWKTWRELIINICRLFVSFMHDLQPALMQNRVLHEINLDSEQTSLSVCVWWLFPSDLSPGRQGPGARVRGGRRTNMFDKSGSRGRPELPELHPQGYVRHNFSPINSQRAFPPFHFLTPQFTTLVNRGCYSSIPAALLVP